MEKPLSFKLEQHCLEDTNSVNLGDTSTGRFHPLVLQTYYETIFCYQIKLHWLLHGGAKATTKFIGERYVFSHKKISLLFGLFKIKNHRAQQNSTGNISGPTWLISGPTH